jgi:2-polyprenyl-3-methyl-5-hydroxy-6-metoxy-1,4-benzoquinol methylase
MFSQKFWNDFPLKHGKEEFFKQVGKTVHGEPISADQFEKIVCDIGEYLDLNQADEVLDLCCGNGLITKEVSLRCRNIVGIDFSEPLIQSARQYHQTANARYVQRSVIGLSLEQISPASNEVNSPVEGGFSKIYMYEALQHLQSYDLQPLLESLLEMSNSKVVILLASVPDKSQIWEFYNTPERRADYLERVRLGSDSMGTWWDDSHIKQVCQDLNLDCKKHVQSQILHTSHYRCDWVIRKIHA